MILLIDLPGHSSDLETLESHRHHSRPLRSSSDELSCAVFRWFC